MCAGGCVSVPGNPHAFRKRLGPDWGAGGQRVPVVSTLLWPILRLLVSGALLSSSKQRDASVLSNYFPFLTLIVSNFPFLPLNQNYIEILLLKWAGEFAYK